MKTSQELRKERVDLVAKARKILTHVEEEKRSINAEEQQEWDRYMADVDKLDIEARNLERIEQAESDLEKSVGRKTEAAIPRTEQRDRGAAERGEFRDFCISGRVSPELRALESTSDPSGGALVLPMQLTDQFIKFVNNFVYVRQYATIHYAPQAKSLGNPALDVDVSDPTWTTELDAGSEDTSMALGRRELVPHPLAKLIKISNKLLRQAPMAEDLVLERLAYKIGAAQENSFMVGNGQNQPLGLFTADANGISTARDVVSGSATSITAAAIVNAFYNVKVQYQSLGVWVFHRTVLSIIRKLVSTTGQFLWQPGNTFTSGLSTGQPDSLMGRPVITSEYAPAAASPDVLTGSTYCGLFGDLKRYVIADALNPQVQRLVELYASTNQTGFVIRCETDGMPALEEAFTRINVST